VKLSNNSWFNFFLNKLSLNTWIDFETEIAKVLDDLSVMFEESFQRKGGFNYYQKDLINVYTDFRPFKFVKSDKEIVEIDSKFWVIGENRLKELEIFKILNDDLNGFTYIFNEYLQKIVVPFLNVPNQVFLNVYNQFERVFTFNYTSTISTIYNYPNEKISYLHGKSDSINFNIVLGVSDINEKLKRLKLFNIAKYYQKIINGCNSSFLSKVNSKTIKEQIIFYVFGHSLDYSDKVYVQELFDFVSQEKRLNSKIIIFYLDDIDKESKLNNILSIINNEKIIELYRDKRLDFMIINEENLKKIKSEKLYRQPGLTLH
ncbi:MAG: hypothetical protein RLZZ500_977, partial [Bacteroidota bacterium]